jgi:hypothetical protein
MFTVVGDDKFKLRVTVKVKLVAPSSDTEAGVTAMLTDGGGLTVTVKVSSSK